MQTLAQYLNQEHNANKVDTIIEHLFKLYPEQLFNAISKVLKQFETQLTQTDQEDKPRIEVAQFCICAILHLLLPTVFEAKNKLAALARSQKNDFRYTLLELPVATRTIVEIMMASVDERSTEFKTLDEGEDLPV